MILLDLGTGIVDPLTQLALKRADHVIEEAIEFYEGVFGAKLEVRGSGGRPAHARWQFGEGDSFFLFNIRERGRDDPHREHISAFGFNVENLEAAYRRAIAAGARNTSPLWMSLVCPVTRGSKIRAETGPSFGRHEAKRAGHSIAVAICEAAASAAPFSPVDASPTPRRWLAGCLAQANVRYLKQLRVQPRCCQESLRAVAASFS